MRDTLNGNARPLAFRVREHGAETWKNLVPACRWARLWVAWVDAAEAFWGELLRPAFTGEEEEDADA